MCGRMEVPCPRKGKQEKLASLVYLTSQATSQPRQDNRTCGSAWRKTGEPGAEGVTPAARVLPGQPGSVSSSYSWPHSLVLRQQRGAQPDRHVWPRNPLGRQAASVDHRSRYVRMVGILHPVAQASQPKPLVLDPPNDLCPEGQASGPRVRSP